MPTEQPGGSYTWRQGLLLYKGRVIVLNDAALQAKVLHEIHDTEVGVIQASYIRSRNWGSSFIGLEFIGR